MAQGRYLDRTVAVTSNTENPIGRAAARWVELVARRPAWFVAAFLLGTAGVLVYTVENLGLNTDETALLEDRLRWGELRDEFNRLFPMLNDPIVVVIDGDSEELAADAVDLLSQRLGTDSVAWRPTIRGLIRRHGKAELLQGLRSDWPPYPMRRTVDPALGDRRLVETL